MGAVRAAGAALLTLTVATACTSSDGEEYQSVAAPRVDLSVRGLDRPVRVGLLVSGSSPSGQGADLLGPAAGARVAQYRFSQGRFEVALEVYDDKGTAQGASAGVRALIDRGVSGIVAATSGSHLDDALREAAAAQVPVLLPYERRDVDGAATAWFTGPSSAQVRDRLRAVLERQRLSHPFVLYGDEASADVSGLASAPYAAAVGSRQSAADTVAPVLRAYADQRIDSVVLAMSAVTQAGLVAEMQGRAQNLPVLLSPDALSPVFGKTLADRLLEDGTATPSGRFLTVGAATVDSLANGSDDGALALTAFLSANRLAAQAPTVQAVTHAVPFGTEGAATADAAAHDAVVALVRAAEKAGSTAPAEIVAALGALSLDHSHGLAGPALDFSSHRAFPGESLIVLASTTQDPGLRAGVGEAGPALSWFALPDEG